jgi:hypothetical protein
MEARKVELLGVAQMPHFLITKSCIFLTNPGLAGKRCAGNKANPATLGFPVARTRRSLLSVRAYSPV